jgi:hypothetical protein
MRFSSSSGEKVRGICLRSRVLLPVNKAQRFRGSIRSDKLRARDLASGKVVNSVELDQRILASWSLEKKAPANPGYKGLGDAIRNQVCQ